MYFYHLYCSILDPAKTGIDEDPQRLLHKIAPTALMKDSPL